MVNIIIPAPAGKDFDSFIYQICEHLQGNKGYKENDIVVSKIPTTHQPNGEVTTERVLISLGDDFTERYEIKAIPVEVKVIEADKNTGYFISTQNGSGIKAHNKDRALEYISELLDQAAEEGIETFDINLGFSLEGGE